MSARADTVAVAAEPRSLAERIEARVQRWVLSRGFQQWATRFPLTRPFARRAARDLFDLVAGFTYTQTLLAAQRLRLLEFLVDEPRSVSEVATRTGLTMDHAARLLDACTALRLTRRRRDGRFVPGTLGLPLLARPELAAMIEHDALLYEDLRDPVALLREGPYEAATRLSRYWAYARNDDAKGLGADEVAPYSALMAASQPLVAADILDAYDVGRHRVLLDVGGGEGGFLAAAAERAPGLALQLVDLPAVVERARQRLGAAGCLDRSTLVGGDFRTDPLPFGADLISLVRVCFDHDDATVAALLRAVHAALPPGGTLVIGEPMSGLPGTEPVGATYFGWYLLAMNGGRPRSADTFMQLCAEAGFSSARTLPVTTPIQTGVVVARR